MLPYHDNGQKTSMIHVLFGCRQYFGDIRPINDDVPRKHCATVVAQPFGHNFAWTFYENGSGNLAECV